MKLDTFIILYPDQTLYIKAFLAEEALILAQADRIRAGKDYKNYTQIIKEDK